MAKILIVEDDITQGLLLQHTIKHTLGCDTLLFHSGEVLKDHLQSDEVCELDCALIDLFLPDMDGVQLTQLLKQTMPDLPIVVMTHYGNRKRAMIALHAGAQDFLHKPIPTQRLKVTLSNMLETQALRKAIGSYKWQPESPPLPHIAPCGSHPQFLARLAEARDAAVADLPILITGEAGTGKTILAQHILNLRGFKRFVSLPWKPGCVLSPLSQGGRASGVIYEYRDPLVNPAALNTFRAFLMQQPSSIGCVSVQADMDMGSSQENLLCLRLNPLRDRKSDLTALTEHFLARLSRPDMRLWIDSEVESAMQHYPWPGNIVELEQFLTAAAAYSQGRIDFREWEYHLQRRSFTATKPAAYAHPPGTALNTQVSLTNELGELRPFKEIEEDIIMLAMQKYDHSPSLVARHLQLGRTTIYRKVQKMGHGALN